MLYYERAAGYFDAAHHRFAWSGVMSGAPMQEEELALGDRVAITGTIVATTRFSNGDVTYSVEYERKGRIVSEWFTLADLDIAEDAE